MTAGPTFEPLDQVRRLTNFSTGRLGSELVNYLAARGHEVTLLIGQQASFRGERKAAHVETFTTTANLGSRLQALSGCAIDAVFHAAAVSDFTFGQVWRRSREGTLTALCSKKFSTREGAILAELVPTPKILADLRDWFAKALLVGWKYEVEGDRQAVLRLAREQISSCRTDACVANGAGYGPGFGLVTGDGNCVHLEDVTALYQGLERLLQGRISASQR